MTYGYAARGPDAVARRDRRRAPPPDVVASHHIGCCCVLEPDRFAYHDRGDSPWRHHSVDDEDVVDATRDPVRLAGPSVFQGKAVLVDAPQPGCKVGHDLLAADHQDHMTCSRRERPELAPAGRRDEEGTVLGDGVDASHDEVWGSSQLAHLAPLHLTVH